MLNNNGYRIEVKPDENDVMKVFITRDDGEEVLFNELYNKTEVQKLVSGYDPDDSAVEKIVASYLATAAVMEGIQFTTYNWVKNKVETVTKNLSGDEAILNHVIKSLNDQIGVMENHISFVNRELVDNYNTLDGKIDDVNDRIDGIRQCDCDHSIVNQLQMTGIVNAFTDNIQQLTLDTLATRKLYDSMLSKSSLLEGDDKSTEIVDPSTGVVISYDDFVKILKTYGINISDTSHQYTDDKPIYGALELKSDLNVNGLVNGIDLSQLSTDAVEFTREERYPKYTATTDTVVLDPWKFGTHEYHSLRFKISDELKTRLSEVKGRIDVFRIVLRKNLFYDIEGVIYKEFYIYAEDGKIYSPYILSTPNGPNVCQFNHTTYDDESLTCAFIIDKLLEVDPYGLFRNGDLSVMYLLNDDALVSRQPVLKCDIIEAKNALKLHESDVYYLYRPTITRSVVIDTTKEAYKMCWMLKFDFDKDYTIPPFLEFRFNEYCFGNKWMLTYDGEKWTGSNVQGHINGKILNDLNKKCSVGNTSSTEGCYIRVRRTDMNKKILNKPDDYSTDNLLHYMIHGGKCKIETKLLLKSGVEEWGSKYQLGFHTGVDGNSKSGEYDMIFVYCYINTNGALNSLNINDVREFYLDITLDGSTTANRFSFHPTGTTKHNSKTSMTWIDIDGVNDTCEKIEYRYEDERVPNKKTDQGFSYAFTEFDQSPRNIMLFLHTDYIDPIDEVNWDPKTNPFEYIVKQQFYEVYPNPNGATTLYTDYNITSSKIITADNITTMRSDLNLVTNNLDVMTYDVKDITNKVTLLNSEMAIQQQKTQYLEHEVDKINVKANVALAFGVAGTVLGAGGVGLGLSAKGITFQSIGENIGGFLKRLMSNRGVSGTRGYGLLREASELELFDLGRYRMRAITTDLTPILTWCDKEYEELPDVEIEDEFDDPETATLTAYATRDLCNRFRESLKPAFKMICNRIIELNGDIDGNAQLLQESYIKNDDLVRDDVIDVTYKVEGNNLLLEFEDDVDNGLLVFRLHGKLPESDNTNSERAKYYIKITDKTISTLKPVDGPMSVTDPATNESINLGGLADSGAIKSIYLGEVSMDGRIITIPFSNGYRVVGVTIEHNSFKRHMKFTVNDIAYTCDVDALSKKIDSLAEITHSNDAEMMKLGDTYTTVDEVNEALGNYALKSDIPSIPDDIVNEKRLTSALSDCVKNKYIKYTWILDKDINITESTGTAYGAFQFTLIDPPDNFTGYLTFHWTNKSGKPTSTYVNVDIVNGALVNIEQGMGILSFQGLSGSLQLPIFRSYSDCEISYENNVLTLPIYRVKVGSQKGLIKDYVFFNETSDDYFASDLVVFTSNLRDYALKSDIPNIPTDLVNESSLSNTLSDYALKSDIPPSIDLSEYRKIDDMSVSTRVHIPFERVSDILYETGTFKNNVDMKGTFVDSSGEDVRFDFIFQKYSNSGENVWYGHPFPSGPGNLSLVNVLWTHDVSTGKYELKVHYNTDRPFTLEEISYNGVDEIALKSDIPDLSRYVLKSELPTDHVTTSSLVNTLSDYSTTSVCDSKYIAKSGNATIDGNLTINSSANIRAFEFTTTATVGNFQVMNLLAPNLNTGNVVGLTIGKARNTNQSLHLYYKEPGVGGLCMFGKEGIITFTNSSIALNQPTTINSNLTVTGKLTSNGSNTITHYAPIEAGQDISSFKVGAPVFASGHVYKRVETNRDSEGIPQYEWESSTINDRSDCICSVVINGTYKEFVGVITDVDISRKCVTFASHGDFLFTVDDSNLYQIGDVILFNGKILDEDYAMTLRIQQSIVGKVTAKINETTLAIFRS